MSSKIHTTIDIPEIAHHQCWLYSDTHFFHKNIARYAGRPNNHQQLIIQHWLENVQENDVVLHLGDLAFGKPEQLAQVTDILPGRKYMVLGNHDRRSKRFYRDHGFNIIKEFQTQFAGQTIHFSHRPGGGNGQNPETHLVQYPGHWNVHGHTHDRNIDHPRVLNVSIEQMEYKPVWLHDYLTQHITASR